MNTRHYRIGENYQECLLRDYGEEIARTITYDWRTAQLPRQMGQDIHYIRLGEHTADPALKPVLFVYGFTGGIVANAPFGAAMAHRGYDIIIPDQNRHGLLKNPLNKRDATHAQAVNMAAIVESEGLQHTALNVVTHSYGSLIFEELARMGTTKGWTCFEDNKVAMLAPSGVKQDERPLDFLKRYSSFLKNGKHLEKFPDSYWSCEKEMFSAGVGHFMANKARSLREGVEIMNRRINFQLLLCRGIGEIAIVPFAEDALFSQQALESSIGSLVSERITAFSPVSPVVDEYGLRSGRGADHNDQQFNPERVAGAIAGYFAD